MKLLAKKISAELKTACHYAVYHPELSRVWPQNDGRRQTLIEKFAKERGWRLRYYKDGFVAIFDKELPN